MLGPGSTSTTLRSPRPRLVEHLAEAVDDSAGVALAPPLPGTISTVTDADYMDQALREAEDAFARGDWPVGSVLVRDGVVLATGQNRQNTERDVTWHAEFEAMRRASREHGAA